MCGCCFRYHHTAAINLVYALRESLAILAEEVSCIIVLFHSTPLHVISYPISRFDVSFIMFLPFSFHFISLNHFTSILVSLRGSVMGIFLAFRQNFAEIEIKCLHSHKILLEHQEGDNQVNCHKERKP